MTERTTTPTMVSSTFAMVFNVSVGGTLAGRGDIGSGFVGTCARRPQSYLRYALSGVGAPDRRMSYQLDWPPPMGREPPRVLLRVWPAASGRSPSAKRRLARTKH